MEVVIEENVEITCPVCSNQVPVNGRVVMHKESNHVVCLVCFKQIITNKITTNEIDQNKCPCRNCYSTIDSEVIRQAFGEEGFKDLLQKNLICKVAKNPDLMFCPQINCGKVISKNGKEIIKCECGFTFHTICGGEYKENHSCKEVLDKLRKQLGDEAASIYKCPTCKYRLVKDSGCNHMSCPFCRHEWCYICGADYNYDHYNGLLRCYSHFTYISLTKFIVLHYLSILFFPLSELVLCVFFIIMAIKSILECCSCDNCCVNVLLIISLILLGLILLPIGFGILVLPLHVLMFVRTVIFTNRAIKKKRLYI
jgi:E3 ubiquitin-protein ligase RNF19A